MISLSAFDLVAGVMGDFRCLAYASKIPLIGGEENEQIAIWLYDERLVAVYYAFAIYGTSIGLVWAAEITTFVPNP